MPIVPPTRPHRRLREAIAALAKGDRSTLGKGVEHFQTRVPSEVAVLRGQTGAVRCGKRREKRVGYKVGDDPIVLVNPFAQQFPRR